MFKRLVFSLLVALAFLPVEAYQTRFWNPNGSGAWADDSRWTIVEQPYSDRIVIRNGDVATMTEADFAFVATQDDILFTDNSTLEITVSGETATFPERPSFTAGSNGNGGAIIKKGAGKLIFGRAAAVTMTYNLPTGGIAVVEGELQAVCGMGPITVKAPGQFRPPAVSGDFNCFGLRGDGTVVSDYYNRNQFCFRGSGVNEFSGTFVGTIDFTVSGNGKQIISNPAANNKAGDVRLYTGELWLNSFGKSGQASSIGSANAFWMRGNPIVLHYTGEGETTDKVFRFGNEDGVRTIDGGPHGGLKLVNDIYSDMTAHKQQRFVIDGAANTKNVFGGGANVSIREDGVNSVYITKKGAGEWEFSPLIGLSAHGAMAVKEGTLSYTTLAEKGVDCALGYSDILYEDYSGAIDESKKVDYAFLLGNGEAYDPAALSPTTATLKYIGTIAARCTTRPISLDGVGRLASTSEAGFKYSGIKANQAKSALVLNAPAGSDNEVRNLDRNGKELTVVQEGAGDWALGGALDVSAVEARAGRMTIKNVDAYEYFRFQAMENYSATDTNIQLGLFGLWDAEGNLRSENIAYRDCVGDASRLLPGEVTDLRRFETSGGGPNEMTPRGRTVENVFRYSVTNSQRSQYDIIWSGNVYAKGKPKLENEESWPGFILRIRPGAPVVAYDLYLTTGFSGSYTGHREIKSWRLEGSKDGVTWVTIDEHIGAEFDSHDYWVWRTTKKEAHAVGEGYAITTAGPTPTVVNNLSVRVDAGATLSAEAPIGATSIVYEKAKGAGTIAKTAFAETGTLVVNGLGTQPRGVNNLTYTFSDCSGLDNLLGWTLVLDGQSYAPSSNKYKLTVTETGISLEKIERPFSAVFY